MKSSFRFLQTGIALTALVSLTTAANVSAQEASIAEFTFASSLNATTADANVTVSALQGGDGLPSKLLSKKSGNVFVRASKTGLSKVAGAIAANEYVSFTVTPNAGTSLNLASLTLKAGYTNDGGYTNKRVTQSVLSSVGGFTPDAVIGSITTPDTSKNDATLTSQDLTVDLSGAQFQGIQKAIEFRIYLSDDTNTGNIIHRLDDIVLQGTAE